jgi:DNA-binding IclR family transcriptional regulator
VAGASGVTEAEARPGAESVRRTLELLLAFTRETHTFSARQLAAETGIPLPTVYRHVALLRNMGLLVGDDQGGFHLSARFITLAQAAEASEPLISQADPVMRGLAAACGETVLLVRMIAGSAVCIHRIESAHRLRISFEPGQALPLTRGASSRILLTSLPPAVLRHRFDELAKSDRRAAERLRADVETARKQGWATSEEEIDPGIWAASAAIFSGQTVVAALTVPSPLVRAPDKIRKHLLDQVRSAADDLSRRLTEQARR